MKEFRLNLATILLSSELNKRKGAPYLDRDENIGSPSDCAIIENPKMADQVSTKKRKHYEEAKCLVVQTGTPQHIQTQIPTSPCQPRPWWVLSIWGHERHANEQESDNWVTVWLGHGNSRWGDVEVSYMLILFTLFTNNSVLSYMTKTIIYV